MLFITVQFTGGKNAKDSTVFYLNPSVLQSGYFLFLRK